MCEAPTDLAQAICASSGSEGSMGTGTKAADRSPRNTWNHSAPFGRHIATRLPAGQLAENDSARPAAPAASAVRLHARTGEASTIAVAFGDRATVELQSWTRE